MHPVGLPRDPAQWAALVLALLAIPLAPRLLRPARPRLFLALAAIAAALLSAAYVAVYLRGGPRIIDATSYWLEARGFARGLLAFPIGEPETSVLGRFLVRSEHGGAPHAAVLFPPGWPAVLALGFLAGAPLAVGPLLAAALVVVTADLAAHLARASGAASPPALVRLAVTFSVISAALRYHTADTMSHGLAALCFATALALLFRALDAPPGPRRFALAAAAGLAAGWLFATRPASALALAVPFAFVLLRERGLRLLPALALGALPGLALFLAYQHAATGSLFGSAQRAYYAVSDGPPDCFRYGFGAGIGCLGEHGDFVRSRLPDGYGLLPALGTTLRRLKAHLVDPLNLEPLALLVPAGAILARGSVRGRALGLALLSQLAAYAPFYFDGNYPAGGGRFLCDLLPIEHALVALVVLAMATRRPAAPAAVLSLSLGGFAFRAGFDHAQLRDRDGGRPLFEAAELARAGVREGLVLVESDHGLGLAFDPGATPAPGALVVRRAHGDDLDALAWDALGRPPAHLYRFRVPPGGGPASVAVEPLSLLPPTAERALRIEGESLWPPLAQARGWAAPEWAAGTCASADRLLALHRARPDEPASVTVKLPAALACRPVAPRLARAPGVGAVIDLAVDGALLHRWVLDAAASPGAGGLACDDLPAVLVPETATKITLTVARPASPTGWSGARAEAPALALDRVSAGPRERHCGPPGTMRFP